MATDLVWTVVTCTSLDEATRIGDAALAARLVSCFEVLPRTLARYFWPPRSGQIEEATGALLILETLESRMGAVKTLIHQHHGDQLPFIGAVRLSHVDASYLAWVVGELTPDRAGDSE